MKLNGLKVGVTRFPGTNCDRDVYQAVSEAGAHTSWLWHGEGFDHKFYDALIIPGGFSFGDYLRAGRLAAKSPVMKDVIRASQRGVPILGICNGFQILCEVGLLPGALLKNEKGRFINRWVRLQQCATNPWYSAKTEIRIPIAHGQGRYFISPDELKRLEDQNQIWWKYLENPNGSVANVAGVMSPDRKIGGLMPHPERCVAEWMGGADGVQFFTH